MNDFTNLTTDEQYDILEVAKKTGNFRNIKISNDLTVSFIKTQENYVKCGLDIVCDYGNGEGPSFHFTKQEVTDGKWKENLEEKLSDCGRNFDKDEIENIATYAKDAIKFGRVDEYGERLELRQVIKELYFQAVIYKEEEELAKKETDRKAKPECHDALLKITIYEDCICINGKKEAFQEILDEIDSGWKALDLKKELKRRQLLNIDKGNAYEALIQTKEARKMGLRKFIMIPLKKVGQWIGEEDINNE